jgi:general secretion pathway protein L
MTAITSSLLDFPWRRLAAKAAGWWLAELGGLLPQFVRSRLSGGSAGALRLDFAADGISLLVPARDRAVPTVIPIAPDGNRQAVLERNHLVGAPVIIQIAESFVFRPSIELPLAAESSLRSIIHHQLERLVPLDPETLRFAWHMTERSAEKNRLRVEVCIVKQATLDRAIGLAQKLGLNPQSVIANGRSQHPSILWRSPHIQQTSFRERTLRRGTEIAAACFAIAAYTVFICHLDARREALRDMVSDLHARTETVRALALRTAAAENLLKAVNKRLQTPGSLAVLDALTQAIPLDGSISEFHVQNGKVEITGTASHATALLGAIGKAGIFDNPSFLAPITAAPDGAGERYQLGFQVNRRSGS